MKIFLDTNVVVSAFATRGLCADLFAVILAGHELMLGETVLREMRRVLMKKMRLTSETVDEIEAYLRTRAVVVDVSRPERIRGLDAADSAVVAAAVAAQADLLVSGDQDLLDLTDPAVPIVSPRGLWERLRRG